MPDGIDIDLLNILACPQCQNAEFDVTDKSLTCRSCKTSFEIRNGVPTMTASRYDLPKDERFARASAEIKGLLDERLYSLLKKLYPSPVRNVQAKENFEFILNQIDEKQAIILNLGSGEELGHGSKFLYDVMGGRIKH